MTTTVHVIGAGVVGLTTAYLLQKEGYEVTIIADYFPGDTSPDYTSPCAGARWKTLAPNSDTRLQRYDAVSFEVFWELAQSYGAEAGIMVVPSLDYYQVVNEDLLHPWFKNTVPDFQMIEKDQLPEGISVGYKYTTVTINPLVYLPWLLEQFLSLGGRYIKKTLNHLSEAITDASVDIIVNCTGVRAKEMGGVKDITVIPTRGQNVLVYAPHIKSTISSTKIQSYTYIIPRSDGTVILGTTKETSNSDSQASEETTRDILERANACCPELSHHKGVDALKIVDNIVGLRPTREGGPRVETEHLISSSGKEVLVAHNYGHGGSGYQSSWGTAKEVLHLIK